jgi:chemotaxis protein methyltransferase CheR
MNPLVDQSSIDQFRDIIARRLGLQFGDGRLDQLAEILHSRMEATRCRRFDAYAELLIASPKRNDEWRTLAEQLTVVETFFFRNADNFRALTERVLPECIRRNASVKRLRILSAGCASGDEPYSLAIALRELLPELESWDVQIVGIDVNPLMLAKARLARYSSWSLRATGDDSRRRYFRTDGRDFVLDPAIRSMVLLQERNLVDDDSLFWQPSTYDVVFCRNVLMYFTPDVMQRVVGRLNRSLVPDGFLFLGHAETLRGVSRDFHLCHTHDTFYYQRRAGNDASIEWDNSPHVPQDDFARTLPGVVETTESWVDVIQRASENIAALYSRPVADAEDVEVEASSPTHSIARPRDFGSVHEAMRLERFSDALALLSALPTDAHEEPEALLLRAALLTNCGRLDDAEETCNRLIALDELSAGAHYLTALCREHAGDAPGAIEHDQIAIHLDDSFAMPHLHMGLIARRGGDFQGAQREIARALVLLASEDSSRLLLFGGGFSRETLLQLCRTELRTIGSDL